MSDDDKVDSVDQDEWIAIARAVRNQLASLVPMMGAMKVEELQSFIIALDNARHLNLNAETFDKDIANALSQTWRDR